MEKSKVEIYTDGACSGNPGPGGWGAVLIYGEHEKQLSGGEPKTTKESLMVEGRTVRREGRMVEGRERPTQSSRNNERRGAGGERLGKEGRELLKDAVVSSRPSP